MSAIKDKIDEFVLQLANESVTKNIINQYNFSKKENEYRRTNLRNYLLEVYNKKPKMMFISECSNYKGGIITGIPFVDENTLLKNPKKFFSKNYIIEHTDKSVNKENTCNVFWSAVENSKNSPDFLLWNLSPFHLYKENDIFSNRKPNKKELDSGIKYTVFLHDIFKDTIENIYSVGKVADSILHEYKIFENITLIKHPAHCGLSEFLEESKKFF